MTAPTHSTDQAAAASASPWAPLRIAAYRGFWLATLAAYVGIWMQNVAAGWLMATLTRSSLLIASVQFATSLPVFLLSLPAGVLADRGGRARLIRWTYGTMLAIGLLVAAVVHAGVIGPLGLLLATLLLGTGLAVGGPAVQAAVADLVPRPLLSGAVNLGGVAYNGARSLGPALAGVLLAWWSPAWVFAASALCMAGMVLVAGRVPAAPPALAHAPPERLISGMRTGLRFAWHTPGVMAPLLRTVLFGLCASAVWALLPLLVTRAGGNAGGFGLLVACLGIGAVASVLVAARLPRLDRDRLTFVAGLVFAVAMAAAALLAGLAWLCALMVLAGLGWGLLLNSGYAVMQTQLPAWVRARVLSIYAVLLQGALALGSLVWGAVAEVAGSAGALLAAAVLLALAMLYAHWRFPLQDGHEAQVTPVEPWIRFPGALELAPDAGPLAVEIEYRIAPAEAEAFIAACAALGPVRRRTGALFWRLYRDLDVAGCYRERFIVDSWAEYLRSRGRLTLADRQVEDRLRAFHRDPRPPRVSHAVTVR